MASPSWPRRRDSTSWTAAGGCASAISAARSPRSRASRAYSTRKNGLPSVRRRSASVSASVGSASETWWNTCAVASAEIPRSWSRSACLRAERLGHLGERARPAAGARARWSSPAAGRRGRRATAASVSSRSTRRLDVSAQCRSSMTSSSGCSVAAVSTCWTTISQARNAAPLSSPETLLGSSEPSRSSTVAHGQSAGAPSSCEQRPHAMVMPWSAAYVASLDREPALADAGVAGERDERRGDPSLPWTTRSTRSVSAASSSSRPASDQPHSVGNGSGACSSGSAGAARGAAAGAGAGSAVAVASWRSTAAWTARSSGPGSRPSSSSSTSRTWRSTASASACRPERASASARSDQARSRSGCCRVSVSSSAATVACSPSRMPRAARSSTASTRSSSSRARSASAAGASPRSANGTPRHSASASSIDLCSAARPPASGAPAGSARPRHSASASGTTWVCAPDTASRTRRCPGRRRGAAARSRAARSPAGCRRRGWCGPARARGAARRRTPAGSRRRPAAGCRSRSGRRACRRRRRGRGAGPGPRAGRAASDHRD